MTADLDVVVVGRIGIDLYPQQSRTRLGDVATFARFLGGSATNVAVATAQLGLRTRLVTAVGADAFGDFARAECERLGVDTTWVGVHPSLATPLAFAELHPPDHFPLVFYRSPAAPDELLRPDDVDLAQAGSASVLWTTGGALAHPSSRELVLGLLDSAAGPHRVHDLDLRPALWPSSAEARRWNETAIERATAVVGNRAEVEMATGTADPVSAARRLMAHGPQLVVVKCGPEGAVFVSASDQHHEPAAPVTVVNGLGAGDAFGGALCWALLHGLGLPDMARLAATAGAIVAGRLACAAAMPTLDELLRESAVQVPAGDRTDG